MAFSEIETVSMSTLPDTETIKSNLVQAYDRMAQLRDLDRYEEWKRRERRDFASRLIREGKSRLLEIGCGTGRDSQWFKENGFSVTGIDLSPGMVRLCRKKGVDARVMDFREPELPPEGFEAIFALNALVHVPRREMGDALGIIRGLLAPDGLFYLGQYGGTDFEGVLPRDNYRPKRFFSFPAEEGLKSELAVCFEEVSWKSIPLEGRDYAFYSSVWRRRET